jgi:predicted metal-dependent HD superfamily phosphohydrolase
MERNRRLDARKILADVPPEKAFYCHEDGYFQNLQQLLAGLENLPDDIYSYHVNPDNNDFANWIRDVIGDTKLARDMIKAPDRAAAVKAVSSRVKYLSARPECAAGTV